MTHSSCKTHGIRAKKQLTDDIGEPLILDMAFKPLLLTPQNYIKRTVPFSFCDFTPKVAKKMCYHVQMLSLFP